VPWPKVRVFRTDMQCGFTSVREIAILVGDPAWERSRHRVDGRTVGVIFLTHA
jgi:hypothetical protein